MRLIKALLAGLFVCAWTTVIEVRAEQTSPVYPGAEWAMKKPEEVGLDTRKLKKLSDYTGGSGCIVRHGYMVYTWGDASRRRDIASAAKPFYAHFLLKALEDGKISSLDERVAKWEPRLSQINKDLGHKDRRITWRHCANQISCYGLAEAPGTAFAYNDWQMALFWDALFLKVYGARYETVDAEVFHPMLTDQLQCQDDPTFMAFGVKDRPGRTGISPRDFARFGLLYLRKGRWKDKQLISREHATMAMSSPLPNSIPRAGNQAADMIPGQRSIGSKRIPDNQCDHVGSYSWLWWTNGVDRHGARHWPDVPVDTFGCFGHGGLRAMVVLPSLDLIISWNDTQIRGAEMENHVLGLLAGVASSNRLSRDFGTRPTLPTGCWPWATSVTTPIHDLKTYVGRHRVGAG
jgi:CubicO group peptidase (beta-lactamase class C family)